MPDTGASPEPLGLGLLSDRRGDEQSPVPLVETFAVKKKCPARVHAQGILLIEDQPAAASLTTDLP
jgi:hypothetical protein